MALFLIKIWWFDLTQYPGCVAWCWMQPNGRCSIMTLQGWLNKLSGQLTMRPLWGAIIDIDNFSIYTLVLTVFVIETGIFVFLRDQASQIWKDLPPCSLENYLMIQFLSYATVSLRCDLWVALSWPAGMLISQWMPPDSLTKYWLCQI